MHALIGFLNIFRGLFDKCESYNKAHNYSKTKTLIVTLQEIKLFTINIYLKIKHHASLMIW